MLQALFAWAVALATGWGLLQLAWPIDRLPRSRERAVGDFAVRFGLAMGLGLCVHSMMLLLLLQLDVLGRGSLVAVDLSLAIGSWIVAHLRRPAAQDSASPALAPDPALGGVGMVSLLLIVGLTAAILLVGTYAFRAHELTPLGAWDAFAIWNLKARFFYDVDGQSWRTAFSSAIAWSHIDYPLLVPAGVTRLWTYAGRESLALSAMQSQLFAALSLLVLFGTVARLRGLVSGCLAGAALIASAAAVRASVDQLADVPVGFFLLSTLAVILWMEEGHATGLRGPLLVGSLAGAAAWTTNEGLLMFVACGLALLVFKPGDPARSRVEICRDYGIGAMIPIALALTLKLAFGGEDDSIAGQSSSMLARLLDPARHAAIVSSFAETAIALAGWPLLAILALLAISLRGLPRESGGLGIRRVALALALQLAGLYVVYLTTPRDLTWHLDSSNLRLFIQLWPSMVLLYFVWLGPCGKLLADDTSTGQEVVS